MPHCYLQFYITLFMMTSYKMQGVNLFTFEANFPVTFSSKNSLTTKGPSQCLQKTKEVLNFHEAKPSSTIHEPSKEVINYVWTMQMTCYS